MTIGYDTCASGAWESGSSPFSLSHTINTSSNRILIVNVTAEDGEGSIKHPTTVTYSGQSLTLIDSTDNMPSTWFTATDLWYILNPTPGTSNVVVTYSVPPVYLNIVSASFYNVEQNAPRDSGANSGNTSTTTINTTVTPNSTNNIVFGAVGYGSNVLSSLFEEGDLTTPTNHYTTQHCTEIGYELNADTGGETVQWTNDAAHRMTLVAATWDEYTEVETPTVIASTAGTGEMISEGTGIMTWVTE